MVKHHSNSKILKSSLPNLPIRNRNFYYDLKYFLEFSKKCQVPFNYVIKAIKNVVFDHGIVWTIEQALNVNAGFKD